MHRRSAAWTGAVVAVSIGGGIAVGLISTGTPSSPPPARSPIESPGSVPPSVGDEVAADGACAPPDGQDSTSALPPEDIRWTTNESSTATWPVSDLAGPTGMRDGLPACFAPSPIGAVLAAITFLFEQTDRSPLQTYPTYAANTSGKEVAIQTLNGHSDGAVQEVMRTPGVETAGYRVDSWSAKRAVVTIAIRLPDGDGVTGWPIELVRVGGDWLVKLRADGAVGDPAPVSMADIREWPPERHSLLR